MSRAHENLVLRRNRHVGRQFAHVRIEFPFAQSRRKIQGGAAAAVLGNGGEQRIHTVNAYLLQHGGNITTLYAHMSRFASKVRNGSRVRQGQTIGYVGATGMVTGAHLHYEYRLNGVHRNPRTVTLPQAEPIAAEYRDQFLAAAGPILEELERYKTSPSVKLALADSD